MLTFVFPGQGSQQIDMASNLFDEFDEFIKESDEILGYSVKELCMNNTILLNKTEYAQPIIYIINALSYLKKVKENGKKPDFVAGHSLGEYNALFASGAFDFKTGLKIVKKRGELMSNVKGGGMAAVIGLSKQQIKYELKKNKIDSIYIANYNSPNQIVVSGDKENIIAAKNIFEQLGSFGKYIPLNVSGPFHSAYMSKVKNEFKSFLDKFSFDNLTIPVISNTYAEPYEQEYIKDILVDQIDHPVRWIDSICYLRKRGNMTFEEIGMGNILTKFINDINEYEDKLKNTDKENNKKVYMQTINDFNDKVVNNVQEDIDSRLGNYGFKKRYNIKYAYLAGGMYNGIASSDIVVRMAKAGFMAFLGTGGLKLYDIKKQIIDIQNRIQDQSNYGVNFLHNSRDLNYEEEFVDLLLTCGVKNVEAASFINVTPALVRFKAKGLRLNEYGKIVSKNRIIAKISRPETAEKFLSPASKSIIEKLLNEGEINAEEGEFLLHVPVADDICVEADSGGHTDGGVAYALIPAIRILSDRMKRKYSYEKEIYIGAAGGIGTPEAIAASFILGADFVMTGSINQCTVEAATSDRVKDLLKEMNIQDTTYAPAGDMFELGAKVQVLKRGLFFPSRANKLYELYIQYNSLEEIDEKTKQQIQEKYFKKSFKDVFEDVKDHYSEEIIEAAEKNDKYKMALIFKCYLAYGTRLALTGGDSKVDYQIHCGPALGAFNQWVKDTKWEDWRNRHVDEIAVKLMDEAEKFIEERISANLL